MLTKAQAKYIQNLGHKKLRENENVFVAEGPKLVLELLREPSLSIQSGYATEAFLSAHPGIENIVEVSEQELQRISFLSTPNQVVALFHKPVFTTPSSFKKQVLLMLDTIQDPGNIGSILRTADWFGVKSIICSKDSADIFNPKVVQSTMGSIARVNVFYRDLYVWLSQQPGIPIYASMLEGKDVTKMNAIKQGMIIIGNESGGIDKQLQQYANEKISIPRKGTAESLNAAVATGIILSYLA